MAETHDLPDKQAQAVLDSVVGLLVDHLKAGDKLRLNGLGILEVKDRAARTGRNPATGATIQIAASKKVAFRPAKELKDAI
ncbi:MAG: HU family DNA-binding protein [Alphaproteobacteria bacterium]|nr:MAG: HU family DNA-binding protein [Alphaproteobacteria bacterium]